MIMKLYNLRIFNNRNQYSGLLLKKKKKQILVSLLSKVIFNILAFSFLLIARTLYIKSLLGCDGDEFKCVLNSNMKYILDDIYYCTHSVLYFLFFLFFLHLKLCSFYQLIYLYFY